MVTKQRKIVKTHKQADVEIWDNILLERAKQIRDKEQIELPKS